MIFVPTSTSQRRDFENAVRKALFLKCQQNWINDKSRMKIAEKPRQVGFSWSDAYDSVAETALVDWPFDCWITSRDQIQAQLYAQDAAYWGRILNAGARDLGETVLTSENGDKISATRLPLDNGRNIYSLSSNVDAQAGKRGTRKLDEFALNKDNRRLYAIAYPGITWGGRLVIFSTHRGSHNFFNELIDEVKTKGNPKKFSLHTITLESALRDGMLVKLKDRWRKLDPNDSRLELTEDAYLQFTKDQCPDEDTFNEEYMCIPSSDDSAFLPSDLILPCRYLPEDGDWETDLRIAQGQLFIGVDVGRDHDLTVIWVLEKINGMYLTRRVIEMQNETFEAQRNRLFPLLELRNVHRCCIDATGLGRGLSDDAKRLFGSKVEEIQFSGPVKEDLAYPLKAAFEDKIIRYPDRREIVADFRAIKKTTTTSGNIRFTADRGKNGHSDRFWAIALALHAGLNPGFPGEFAVFGQSGNFGAQNDMPRRHRRACVG